MLLPAKVIGQILNLAFTNYKKNLIVKLGSCQTLHPKKTTRYTPRPTRPLIQTLIISRSISWLRISLRSLLRYRLKLQVYHCKVPLQASFFLNLSVSAYPAIISSAMSSAVSFTIFSTFILYYVLYYVPYIPSYSLRNFSLYKALSRS